MLFYEMPLPKRVHNLNKVCIKIIKPKRYINDAQIYMLSQNVNLKLHKIKTISAMTPTKNTDCNSSIYSLNNRATGNKHLISPT